MTYPHGGAGQIWRDGTPPHNPEKGQIRDYGRHLEAILTDHEAQLSSLTLAGAVGWSFFADLATGLAATTSGDEFSAPDEAGDYLVLWRNDSGSGVEVARLPTGNVNEKLDTTSAQANYRINATVDPASTASNIILTGPEVPRYPAVGTSFTFEATQDFVPLDDSGSPYHGQITVQTKDASGDFGGRYAVRPRSNGATPAGMIQNRQLYAVVWRGVPSNSYRLSGYGDIAYSKATSAVLIAWAVGGTADAIEITTDFMRVDGSLVIWKAAATNTSPTVTLRIIDQFGNESAATPLRHSDTLPLRAGDIAEDRWYAARYDASGGNPWILIASGVTLGDVQEIADDLADVTARVGVLEAAAGVGAFAAEAHALAAEIKARPLADGVTWVDGVKIVPAPLNWRIGGIGPSTGLGAGSSDGSIFAPSAALANEMTDAFGVLRNMTFTLDNQSVGGQVISEFAAQWAAMDKTALRIVAITSYMNSMFPGASNAGEGYESQKPNLIALVQSIRAEGAVPVLWTTPSAHPERSSFSIPTQTGMVWPWRSFLLQNQPFTVDVTAQTITSGLFANAEYGGHMLQVGDDLLISGSGGNNGTHTITAISGDRTQITVDGTLLVTEAVSITVKHVNYDSELVGFPRPSEAVTTRDFTGSGVQTEAMLMAAHARETIFEVAQEEGCAVLDAFAFAQRAVEVHGWDAMFDAGQYNHLNDFGISRSWHAAGSRFVDHLSLGTLKDNQIIRPL